MDLRHHTFSDIFRKMIERQTYMKILHWIVDSLFEVSVPKLMSLIAGVLIKGALVLVTALAALSPWCVTQIRDYDLARFMHHGAGIG
jgi:hypothetical protein